MIDPHALLFFALAFTAAPGLDMLLVAARSATQGRRAGLWTYFGIAAGTLNYALALW